MGLCVFGAGRRQSVVACVRRKEPGVRGGTPSDDEHGHGVVQGRLGVPELLRDLATFGFPACPRIGLVKKPGPALLSSLVSFARSVFC